MERVTAGGGSQGSALGEAAQGEATLQKCNGQVLLVDRGRHHCQHLGLCSGGAADMYAYHWANQLSATNMDAAVLEITLGPVAVTFHSPTVIALSGASCEARINGRKLYNWAAARVGAGETLSLGMASSGLRTYLAVAGGFVSPQLFGSCERLNPDASQRLLVAGEVLHYPLANQELFDRPRQMLPWHQVPDHQSPLTLHLHPCYQFDGFPADEIDRLVNSEFVVSPHSNRMGYRLEGEEIRWRGAGIVSEGIALGSVQVPPDGQPIVLLGDRQTIGGYPKLGCVHAADCYQLAQRRPGQRVSFALAPLA